MTSGILGRVFSRFPENLLCNSFLAPQRFLLRMSAFVLIALAGGRAWAQQVVISQIYGGSTLTGSTYNRDYVELHNRGASAVSLTGWSVRTATSTGSTWTSTNLTSGSIAAGGYFLVQMTTSGTIGAALPTPNFISTTNNDVQTASGKVALVSNQLTLPSQIAFQIGSNGIVDFVGFGQTSPTAGPNGFEGSGGTPGAGAAALAIYRNNNGCQDTHDNAADFGAPALPAARNSASPIFNCTATGACCNGTSCSYVDAGSCGGSYQGDFSLCGTVTYPAPSSPGNAFDDISATGTLQAALDNSDDGQVTVAIAPPFTFFGNARSQVSFGVNGLLTFLPGTTATSFSPVAIPAIGTPNDLVAALWMDLYMRTPQIPTAHMYTQQKTAPNRFIVQWNQVSTRSSGTTTPDSLTFQVILNQDTGTVEYRYSTMTTTATTPAYAAVTGIEDQSGTLGSSFSGGSFAGLASSARLFTPGGQSACSPPVNDLCSSASSIPAAGTGSGGGSGTNPNAPLDGGATARPVASDNDVWLAFQPSTTGAAGIPTL